MTIKAIIIGFGWSPCAIMSQWMTRNYFLLMICMLLSQCLIWWLSWLQMLVVTHDVTWEWASDNNDASALIGAYSAEGNSIYVILASGTDPPAHTFGNYEEDSASAGYITVKHGLIWTTYTARFSETWQYLSVNANVSGEFCYNQFLMNHKTHYWHYSKHLIERTYFCEIIFVGLYHLCDVFTIWICLYVLG